MDDTAKLARISGVIRDEASRDAREMIESALSKKDADLERARIELGAEVDEYIRRESAKIKSDAQNNTMRYGIGCRRLLLAVRETYIEKVFALTREKLGKFTSGDAYEPYLAELYKRASELLGGVDKLRVSVMDVEKLRRIAPGTAVEASDEIKLGGLVAERAGLVADYSFDRRLLGKSSEFAMTDAFLIDG